MFWMTHIFVDPLLYHPYGVFHFAVVCRYNPFTPTGFLLVRGVWINFSRKFNLTPLGVVLLRSMGMVFKMKIRYELTPSLKKLRCTRSADNAGL